MADNLMEYKCPHCGGVLEFDSASQKMKCPYCDSAFDVEELKGRDQALDQAPPAEQPGAWAQGETDHMGVYTCKSCGGEIVADKTTGATHCPFCGNPVVLTGQFSGDLKPDLVLPFQVDKNAAVRGLKQHMSGKKLLPRLFSKDSHLQEVKGVYVPVWLFDAQVEADLRYKATKTKNWSDNQYHYTETEEYQAARAGTVAYENLPVDGSSKVPADMLEALEPFDVAKAKPFQTAYLSGYLADRYDLTAEAAKPRAEERMRRSAEDAFRSTVEGFSTVETQSAHIRLQDSRVRYALYPVWLLHTRWKDKDYQFAMNGQSGKFVGDLPVDKSLLWKYRAIYGGIIAAVIYGVAFLVSHL